MFGFGKKKRDDRADNPAPPEPEIEEQAGFFSRLKQKLSKTRNQLTDGLADLVLGKKSIDADLLEELETLLLMADVGVDATSRIIDDLTDRVKRAELSDPTKLTGILKQHLFEILSKCDKSVVPSQRRAQSNPGSGSTHRRRLCIGDI